ncbi:PA4642 family protein [Marinobacter salinisoli]|uniref:PA4642 family protein n=1 Tax=Marinobacter salinisoli TaxID=2769486 RepID=A0ABX7MTW7_9GAMM|nr:PA4642 family protein [Marinobacter salinisoli]QSP95603.1 PA4642 family protein [Marinobacter salinisoli]
MSGPDKPKVIGEDWSDERVKSFLAIDPYNKDLNPDFYVLLKAYQSMRAGDFERFIGFFQDAGRDLNAVNEHGETILDLVSQHRRSVDYARMLEKAGAKATAAADH